MSNHGKTLAAERQAAKLSQRQLADALGMGTAQYISNVERGKCRLSANHFRKLPGVIGRAATERLIAATLKDDRDYYNSLLPK